MDGIWLTHFSPMSNLYTPWKRQKTSENVRKLLVLNVFRGYRNVALD